MYFIWYLLIGLAAGWLANLIVKGGSAGLLGNLIGLVPVGTLGSLATAVIGAVVLLWIAAIVNHRRIR